MNRNVWTVYPMAWLVLLSLAWVGNARADETVGEVDIEEWTVPWDNTRPRDPYVDHRGRVWFCGQAGNYIAYLEPDSGEFKRYDLDPGALPHNLVVDGPGMVWYAGNGDAHIGRLNPATGAITKYPMPDPAARDPHTLVLTPDGNLWFTVQHGNFIGRLKTANGQIDLIKVPTPNARPYGIRLDNRGRPWVALFGTHKLAMVNSQTLVLEEIALPRTDARPRRLAITSGGIVWYGDYPNGRLGSFDPDENRFREWTLPGGKDALPYGMAADNRGRLWIAATGPDPNRLIGFDTATAEFIGSTAVPSGAGSIRHMYYHLADRAVWFGTDANTIGRARLP